MSRMVSVGGALGRRRRHRASSVGRWRWWKRGHPHATTPTACMVSFGGARDGANFHAWDERRVDSFAAPDVVASNPGGAPGGPARGRHDPFAPDAGPHAGSNHETRFFR